MTFFETLARDTLDERNRFLAIPQIVDGLAGRISRETYVAYLTQAYHHVSHTVPLMRLALSRLGPSHAFFARALEGYIAEETGHEQWILDDIGHCGGNRADAAASAPTAATSAMIAHAYDVVGKRNPMGLFGMIFVLEGVSIALASQGAARLAVGLGLGPECFSYLTSHGALDQDHMAFFQGLMTEVNDPADQEAIVQMARRMFGLFGDMFRSIPHDRSIAHAV